MASTSTETEFKYNFTLAQYLVCCVCSRSSIADVNRRGSMDIRVDIGSRSCAYLRPGSNDRPADLLLDRLETYQFDTLSPTTLKLIDDVGDEPDVQPGTLAFELHIGNFLYE